jgi:hypothetical protein
MYKIYERDKRASDQKYISTITIAYNIFIGSTPDQKKSP